MQKRQIEGLHELLVLLVRLNLHQMLPHYQILGLHDHLPVFIELILVPSSLPPGMKLMPMSMRNFFPMQPSSSKMPSQWPSSSTTAEPTEFKYKEQLKDLMDMGFTDEELNKKALMAAVRK